MSLKLKPCTISKAKEVVKEWHRHLPVVQGGLFAVSIMDDQDIVGVAIVGRPVARRLQDGWTAEIVRVATNGAHNGNSMLYGACRSAARALGYSRLVTYTLPEEGGASLRAAGFTFDGEAGGGEWSCKSRSRKPSILPQRKLRWSWKRDPKPEVCKHGSSRNLGVGWAMHHKSPEEWDDCANS